MNILGVIGAAFGIVEPPAGAAVVAGAALGSAAADIMKTS